EKVTRWRRSQALQDLEAELKTAALREAALFARPGRALLLGRVRRRIRFDPGGRGARLTLLVARGEGGDGIRRAVRCARHAGATAAWQPGRQPGNSALVLLPQDRLSAVRTAVSEEFRGAGLPVPRFVSITVAGPARRED
ncbi:hypothetical protein AB0M39_35620, partial [Streptomyces sp. NPDC051907]